MRKIIIMAGLALLGLTQAKAGEPVLQLSTAVLAEETMVSTGAAAPAAARISVPAVPGQASPNSGFCLEFLTSRPAPSEIAEPVESVRIPADRGRLEEAARLDDMAAELCRKVLSQRAKADGARGKKPAAAGDLLRQAAISEDTAAGMHAKAERILKAPAPARPKARRSKAPARRR